MEHLPPRGAATRPSLCPQNQLFSTVRKTLENQKCFPSTSSSGTTDLASKFSKILEKDPFQKEQLTEASQTFQVLNSQT